MSHDDDHHDQEASKISEPAGPGRFDVNAVANFISLTPQPL